MAPAAAQEFLCRGDPSASVSMGCLPQHLWELPLHPEQYLNGFHLNNLCKIFIPLLLSYNRSLWVSAPEIHSLTHRPVASIKAYV
jgi:hypothetical protein